MNIDAARFPIAASVSPEARIKLEGIRAFLSNIPQPPVPETVEDFDAAAARAEVFSEQLGKAAIDALGIVATERMLGGVATLDILPKDYADDGSIIVYVHGGGFVTGSARANLLSGALAAATSGRRVVSVDYTLAPRGTWDVILDQVVAVWTALLDAGADHSKMGLFGDSAGGCIVAATALLLRDRNIAPPAGVIMLSPVVDLSGEGDTTVTLAPVDYLDSTVRLLARNAYAPNADLTDPLVSPLFGDFAKGYPPVLIQVGTREMLLSDSVRLHRALRAAGRSSRLEVYEGMPHVFQSLLADAPEGREAWAEMAAFWTDHLT
ncbi:alpha/beta hydrolase [Sphingomonas sp. Leaf357]|uniref:alpha/beta hydrolase n=1 Tax=Sphingomonas sp. Leaf357 TaxID=1736350 RepID=UPI0006F2C405|nr:alpha/beta hydrolase [Sphingomonas sp. Leaf357]KQS04154.1 alpha/beta hydrolase [Sphingomonas sp. Leaf357]